MDFAHPIILPGDTAGLQDNAWVEENVALPRLDLSNVPKDTQEAFVGSPTVPHMSPGMHNSCAAHEFPDFVGELLDENNWVELPLDLDLAAWCPGSGANLISAAQNELETLCDAQFDEVNALTGDLSELLGGTGSDQPETAEPELGNEGTPPTAHDNQGDDLATGMQEALDEFQCEVSQLSLPSPFAASGMGGDSHMQPEFSQQQQADPNTSTTAAGPVFTIITLDWPNPSAKCYFSDPRGSLQEAPPKEKENLAPDAGSKGPSEETKKERRRRNNIASRKARKLRRDRLCWLLNDQEALVIRNRFLTQEVASLQRQIGRLLKVMKITRNQDLMGD